MKLKCESLEGSQLNSAEPQIQLVPCGRYVLH